MDFWNDIVVPRLQHLTALEYFTFAVNAVVFLFSKSIASHYGEIRTKPKCGHACAFCTGSTSPSL